MFGVVGALQAVLYYLGSGICIYRNNGRSDVVDKAANLFLVGALVNFFGECHGPVGGNNFKVKVLARNHDNK